MTKATFRVIGLNCGKCVARVEKAIKGVAGVQNANVTLQPPQAMVETDGDVSLDVLQAAVSEAGEYQLLA